MMIRRYAGTDEKSIVRRIRSELGPEAVILHTAYKGRKGVFGFFRSRSIEVVAGAGFRIVKDYPNGNGRTAAPKTATPKAAARPAAREKESPELRREVAELKKLVAETQDLVRWRGGSDDPPELAEQGAELAASRMSEKLARRLARGIRAKLPAGALRDRAKIRACLRDQVKRMLRCADGIALKPGKCVRVAFVGPTGVGKTTTIAKLLSIYAHRGCEVAAVTNDTYRIAATEQIRRVAQLVGVPIRVCPRPEDVKRAMAEFADRDLVLVDTAGRSQKNPGRLGELKEVLSAVKPDETHLVVSLTSQAETLVDVAERFAPCGFDRLVVTKLDEALKVGVVLDVLSRMQTELSFVTTGQEIPRDIEVADADRLTALILGEEAL